MVTDTIVNGIGILGPEIKGAFHLSNAGLGAVIFVGAVAQIGWGMPVAVFADRGSRKNVAAITLLIFSVTIPLMALVHNVWPFVFLYLIAAIGLGSSDTVHNAYLSDAYPTNGRARVFTWHNMNDPVSQTIGILLVGYIASATHNWRWALALAVIGVPVAIRIFFIREPEKGANESSHILKAAGMDIETEQENAPKVLLGSAVTRLLRIRSLYYELVAVAILGFAGTGIPLFGSLYFQRHWHLGVAHRADVFSIIGLSAFLGLPVVFVVGDKLFRRAPRSPSSSPASASPCSAASTACRCTCRTCGWSSSSSSWPSRRWRPCRSASSRPWRRRPPRRCGPSASASSASMHWSSADSRAGSCSAPSATPPTSRPR